MKKQLTTTFWKLFMRFALWWQHRKSQEMDELARERLICLFNRRLNTGWWAPNPMDSLAQDRAAAIAWAKEQRAAAAARHKEFWDAQTPEHRRIMGME